MSAIVIRPVEPGDMPAIRKIFNHYIKSSRAIFMEDEVGEGWESSFIDAHSPTRPAIAAISDGSIAGWASISDYSSRCCYRDTGEISVYVDEKMQGHGLGKRLAVEIEERALEAGLHSLVALIESGNAPSISLFERLGYERIGLLREAGFKFGKRLDVVYYQKIIGRR